MCGGGGGGGRGNEKGEREEENAEGRDRSGGASVCAARRVGKSRRGHRRPKADQRERLSQSEDFSKNLI